MRHLTLGEVVQLHGGLIAQSGGTTGLPFRLVAVVFIP